MYPDDKPGLENNAFKGIAVAFGLTIVGGLIILAILVALGVVG